MTIWVDFKRISFALVFLYFAGCVINKYSGHWTEKGIASYYARKFEGRRTASGEIYDPKKLTAAHRWLPFGTIVKVTNLENGKSVIVRINDRGPFVKGRIIDLSYRAARELGIILKGTAKVKIEVLKWGKRK